MIDAALVGVLFSGAFVACVAVIQQLTVWKFYSELPDALVPWKNMWMFIRDFRGGLMRTPATMAPNSFWLLYGNLYRYSPVFFMDWSFPGEMEKPAVAIVFGWGLCSLVPVVLCWVLP